MTDKLKKIVWNVEFDPFGNELKNHGRHGQYIRKVKNNLRFTGQYDDKETKTHYNGKRTYWPSGGRYLEADPIGIAYGANHLYAYAKANPVIFNDPSGLAYFAKRPLWILPWLGPLSCNPGGIDDKSNTEISHEHLFFEDGKAPLNIGCGPKGLFTELKPQGYRCRSGEYNDFIMRKAYKNIPCPYSLIKSNCQDWTEAVRIEYQRLTADPQVKKECECEK